MCLQEHVSMKWGRDGYTTVAGKERINEGGVQQTRWKRKKVGTNEKRRGKDDHCDRHTRDS